MPRKHRARGGGGLGLDGCKHRHHRAQLGKGSVTLAEFLATLVQKNLQLVCLDLARRLPGTDLDGKDQTWRIAIPTQAQKQRRLARHLQQRMRNIQEFQLVFSVLHQNLALPKQQDTGALAQQILLCARIFAQMRRPLQQARSEGHLLSLLQNSLPFLQFA